MCANVHKWWGWSRWLRLFPPSSGKRSFHHRKHLGCSRLKSLPQRPWRVFRLERVTEAPDVVKAVGTAALGVVCGLLASQQTLWAVLLIYVINLITTS